MKTKFPHESFYPSCPRGIPDLSTRIGAYLHKAKLEQWYRDNGEPVPKFHVVAVNGTSGKGHGQIYTVLSDLKFGVPKG